MVFCRVTSSLYALVRVAAQQTEKGHGHQRDGPVGAQHHWDRGHGGGGG